MTNPSQEERERIVAMNWFELRQAVNSAAPDLDPPPQHWLESECSESFCRKCAIAARGREFELGPLLHDPDGWERTPWEEAYYEGISAYMHRCAGESDNTEACATCGITLSYWLTDYGIVSELDHWEGAEMSGDLSEIAYNLDRLFECKDEDRPAVRALALRFLEYALTHQENPHAD